MTNETTNEDAPQYPLANDASGNPLDVPAEAVAWRVRKLARRAGRPKVLFDVETGRPLELPLTVTFDDFVEQVNEPGRFRLEAVDGAGRLIPGCVAVTEVVLDGEDGASMPRNAADAVPHLHQLIAQLVEANTQVMKAMASAFGSVQPQPMRIDSVAAAPLAPRANANPMQALDAMREIGAMVNQVVGTIAALRNGMTPSTAPQVG